MSAAVRRLFAALALAERGATPGERCAAEQAIGRLIVANADAFRTLLDPQKGLGAQTFTEPPAPAWRETVAECLARPGSLRPWEIGFLHDLQRWGRRLSPKQRAIVNEIAVRVGVMAEAAA